MILIINIKVIAKGGYTTFIMLSGSIKKFVNEMLKIKNGWEIINGSNI